MFIKLNVIDGKIKKLNSNLNMTIEDYNRVKQKYDRIKNLTMKLDFEVLQKYREMVANEQKLLRMKTYYERDGSEKNRIAYMKTEMEFAQSQKALANFQGIAKESRKELADCAEKLSRIEKILNLK